MNRFITRLSLTCISFWAFLLLSPSQAQISSDGSLPVPTTATNEGNSKFTITDGTQVGNNLFHSFQDFSIPTKGSATFQPSASIINIIGRVTGNQASLIDGSLQVVGQANLFFLNPNGIIFGKNATLNLNGSFLATTAQAIRFADGQIFSTIPTGSLLTVSVPIGLQFGEKANGIQVQQSTLSLPSQQTLGLVGGALSLTRANLSVVGGRVELGSVGQNSEVNITQNAPGYSLGYEQVKDFQDIRLSQGTVVDVTDPSPLLGGIEVGSGAIQVFGRRLSLTDGSVISSFSFGEKPGKVLTINASESLEILGTGTFGGTASTQIGSSSLATITLGDGNGGDINITTQRLIVQDGGGISTRATSSSLNPNPVGNSGNLTINASDSVTIAGSSPVVGASALLVSTQASGNAGNLTLNTGILNVTDGGKISAQTLSSGPLVTS